MYKQNEENLNKSFIKVKLMIVTTWNQVSLALMILQGVCFKGSELN